MKKLIALILTFMTGVAFAQVGGTGVSGLTTSSSSVISLWTGTCSASTFLRGDGQCSAASGTGGGTVTSVDVSVPSWLVSAGGPISTSGVIAISPAGTQTANEFVATPDGVTGTVGLRAIVAGDLLPIDLSVTTNGGIKNTLGVAHGGSGATTLTGLLKGNGTSAFTVAASSDVTGLWTGTCNNTTVLEGDGACVQINTQSLVTSVSNGRVFFALSNGVVTDSDFLFDIIQDEIYGPNLNFKFGERTAPASATGYDVCYADSTAHALECSFNNDAFSPVIRQGDAPVLPISHVSALPTCNSGTKGQLRAVDDATSPTYHGALTGSGGVGVPVYCDGTSWTAH